MKKYSNDDPAPNIQRQIRKPGPDGPNIPQDEVPGYGQGGQPPHEYPGQPPGEPGQPSPDRRKPD